MIKKKKLKKWIEKRVQVISDHLTAYCTVRRDEEDLHKIRVEIKKLRALIYMFRNLNSNRHKSEKNLLKELFQHTGRIRDAQLQLHFISELHIEDPGFIYEELKCKEREEKLLILRLEEYQYNLNKVKKGLLKKLNNIDTLEAQSLIKLEWDKVVHFLISAVDTETMHDERKKLKQLMYLLRLLPEQIADTLGIDQNFLDELADKIGKWHDLLITAQMLRERKEPPGTIDPINEKARNQLDEIKNIMNDFSSTYQ